MKWKKELPKREYKDSTFLLIGANEPNIHATTMEGTVQYEGPQVKHLNYILLKCDTRPLEFCSGVFLFMWALWLLAQLHVPLVTFKDTIGQHGGVGLWAGVALLNFLYQVLSIQWRWPTLRRSASCLCLTYWFAVAWMTIGDSRLFFPYIALFWAAIQFWILAHRVAASK